MVQVEVIKVNEFCEEYVKYKFCIRIFNEEKGLDFDDIEKNLPILPTRKYKAGDKYINSANRPTKRVVDNDIWLYQFKCQDNENIYQSLKRNLQLFLPHEKYLRNLAQKYTVCFRVSMTSDFAQMYLEMPADIIQLISELGLTMEISILSFGQVIDKLES